MKKQCSKCKKLKPVGAFYRRTDQDAYRSHCITCFAKSGRQAHQQRRRAGKVRLKDSVYTQISRSVDTWILGSTWGNFVTWTFEELCKHLETLFRPNMSWKNYGKWHLDHIRPKYAFEMPTPESEGFQQCWALENLQPLWGTTNQHKGKSHYANMYFDERKDWEPEE